MARRLTRPELRDRHVLVIDDNAQARQVLADMLQSMTFDVHEAPSGPEGLELVRQAAVRGEPYDVVFVDWQMPGMDGIETGRGILGLTELSSPPHLVMVTAYGREEIMRRSEDTKFESVLIKPVTPSMLFDSVVQALSTDEHKESEPRKPKASVAGNFYDFLVLDDKRVAILVAVVSGHGMPAALIASMLKIALAARADHATDPTRVLQGLNHALCGKFQYHYVTAAYVFLDMEKRTMTYAGAGHPPMLVWGASADGVRGVEENGLFLGKFDFATYSSVELPLLVGEFGLLYTDGIAETNNPDEVEFGAERFRPFLASQKEVAVKQFADALLAEVATWSARPEGADLDDDITMVAFQVR